MHYEVEVDGRLRRVAVRRVAGGFAVAVDDRTWRVSAARVDDHTLSLIVGAASRHDERGPVETGARDGRGEGGASHDVTVTAGPEGRAVVRVGARPFHVVLNPGRRRHGRPDQAGDGPQRIAAPMPGKVVRILVRPGDVVGARQPLIVVEAMKMENELRAGHDGTVAEIFVTEGASVEAGARLMDIR